ncbi:cytochrome P450 27C1 [Aplysia californica]|uniref:Cytochrome P450 27C1 n=1 Tax=Aplysia californica TaxID=6500 RepID=A0ABM1ABG8_APLCA|nr:cytochrome P450 27C1 [Aplysia californica]
MKALLTPMCLNNGAGTTGPLISLTFSRLRSVSPQCSPHGSSPEAARVRSFDEIPGPKGPARWPVIGPAFLFKPFTSVPPTRPDLMTKELHQKYGDIVRIRLPFGHTVLVKDPADMLMVFQNEGRYPSRPNFDVVNTYFKSRNMKTLSTANGEEWRHLRMRVQPKFMRPSATDPYVSSMNLVADDLAACIETGAYTELNDVIFRYVVEALRQFCFSRRIGALPMTADKSNDILIRVKQLFSILGAPPLLPLHRLWKTKPYKIVEENLDFLIGVSRQEVERAIGRLRNSSEASHEGSPHFIQTMLSDSDLKPDEIVMSMSEFFFGGTDTVSSFILFW